MLPGQRLLAAAVRQSAQLFTLIQLKEASNGSWNRTNFPKHPLCSQCIPSGCNGLHNPWAYSYSITCWS
jgi:hypothetical protein